MECALCVEEDEQTEEYYRELVASRSTPAVVPAPLLVRPTPPPLVVAPLSSSVARDIAEKNHYMHRKPPVSYAWGLHQEDEIVGIITLGIPASRHLQAGACPTDPSLVIELNRMWIADELPNGTASWFLARALRQAPPRIVVSYADTTVGHLGYVYRAANFRYGGWTDMDRKTPRYDYLPADPATHTRDAFRNGYDRKVRRKPKIRYWTTTGNHSERRKLARLCGWLDLDWNKIPPPREHQRLVLPD
jgi:hypothetical protein